MLKFFNANQKRAIEKLELITYSRKLKQKNQSSNVKKILFNVKKLGDKAIINYEKKFSNIKSNPKKIIFSKNEISRISKKIDKKLKYSIDVAYSRIKDFISIKNLILSNLKINIITNYHTNTHL